MASSHETTTLEIIPQIGTISGKTVKIPERPWIKDEFIDTIEVETMTLDALFKKYHVQQADIVKIDVEGLEYDILRSTSILERIKKIVVEYHNHKIRKALITLLKENGFALVHEDHEKNMYYGDLYFQRRYPAAHRGLI